MRDIKHDNLIFYCYLDMEDGHLRRNQIVYILMFGLIAKDITPCLPSSTH